MGHKDYFVSIIVPCYNEGKNLVRNMEKLIRYCKIEKLNVEYLLINDGSSDDTLLKMKEVQESFADEKIRVFEYGGNRGKGYAVRYGFKEALGERIFFMDADLSTDIRHVTEFLRLLETHPIVIGSRKKPGDNIIYKQSPFRVFIGKGAKLVTEAIIDLDFYDTQCGFKAFRREVIDDIMPHLQIDRFCFDVEILYLGKSYGYNFEEVPVNWKNDPNSSVHPVKDGLKFAMDLLKIRKLHRRG